jgi:tRNA(Ile)-lysidine synthase
MTSAWRDGEFRPAGPAGGADPPASDPAAPLGEAEFADLMLPLGPFESNTHLAVAVSGGSDSLALTLLLADWVAARNGRLSALSVDHGLRPAAAGECRRVGEILAQWSVRAGRPVIDHHILRWTGAKPQSGIMAAARMARYALLTDWCRDRHILHLVVAHQAEDQVETYLMRQARGSGAHGLAVMPAIRPLDGVRLLRPLLAIGKARLQALLRQRGIDWIEDPSNVSPRFERVRWRARAATADKTALIAAVQEAGGARDRLDRDVAGWLARHGHIDPAGYARLDLAGLKNGPAVLIQAMLRDLISMIGAADYPPGPAKLAALISQLTGRPAGQVTLGGCHIAWRMNRLAIYREAASCEGPRPVRAGEIVHWDKRYRVDLMRPPAGDTRSWEIAAVGKWGLANQPISPTMLHLPLPARRALPALWQDGRIIACPSWRGARTGERGAGPDAGPDTRPGQNVAVRDLDRGPLLDVAFLPRQGATSCGFAVVRPQKRIM